MEQTPIVAELRRSGFVEGCHRGTVVVTDPGGAVIGQFGDANARVYPRSAIKPAQAVAMRRAGLTLEDARLTALSTASHSGEEFHLDAVRDILASAGLDEAALRCIPDLPYGEQACRAWLQAGRGPERITMNCSGKHAAMPATCVVNGWPTDDYLDPDHPLQQGIRTTIADLTGDEPADQSTDGCGAPLWSLPLASLARMIGRVAAAPDGSHEAAVRDAMRAHPEYVGGTGRDVTELMAQTPGVIAKDGAEAVGVVGLPDGTGIAVKIDDGGQRARVVVLASVLKHLGVDSTAIENQLSTPVLGGGEPVGEVRATVNRGDLGL